MSQPAIFSRLERMLGTATLDALRATRVALFGLGGVGSWCAESLVRSGVGHLLLVDSDRVCATNVNRQLMATTATVGASTPKSASWRASLASCATFFLRASR